MKQNIYLYFHTLVFFINFEILNNLVIKQLSIEHKIEIRFRFCYII